MALKLGNVDSTNNTDNTNITASVLTSASDMSNTAVKAEPTHSSAEQHKSKGWFARKNKSKAYTDANDGIVSGKSPYEGTGRASDVIAADDGKKSLGDKLRAFVSKAKHEVSSKYLDTNPISEHADLMAFKPDEKLIFHSDFFQIDDCFASIVTYVHTLGSSDTWPAFWGCNRFPSGLNEHISTVNFEQVSRMTSGWVTAHQEAAERAVDKNAEELDSDSSRKKKVQASSAQMDIDVINQELLDGDAYLNVHNRMLVKAPTLEMLDEAIKVIERAYTGHFGTLSMAAYQGDQAGELQNLFAPNEAKRGAGEYFTSTEFAGSYALVSHGFEDKRGIYVGDMQGDINTAAVLFDVDGYDSRVIVCSEQYDTKRKQGSVSVADEWASKISQSALMDGHRVVHLVLNNADMDKLGPKFDNITYRIDLSRGDVNMFEMFGDPSRELEIFAVHMNKLKLMTAQLYKSNDSGAQALIDSDLIKVATQFYIGKHMWVEDAPEHRDKLRIVGLPHTQVPRMQDFQSYLETEHKAALNSNDTERIHVLNVLKAIYSSLLTTNADLFNQYTSDSIDGARSGMRVIYDFSGLTSRGEGIAMAQLVNVLSYAVDSLGQGDVLIVHGADTIDPAVRPYVTSQFDRLSRERARVVWVYNGYDSLFEDADFNHFDTADYTIFGSMSAAQIEKYEELMHSALPDPLKRQLATKSNLLTFIHRGFDNVIFDRKMYLDGLYASDAKSIRRWRSRS